MLQCPLSSWFVTTLKAGWGGEGVALLTLFTIPQGKHSIYWGRRLSGTLHFALFQDIFFLQEHCFCYWIVPDHCNMLPKYSGQKLNGVSSIIAEICCHVNIKSKLITCLLFLAIILTASAIFQGTTSIWESSCCPVWCRFQVLFEGTFLSKLASYVWSKSLCLL